MVTCELCGRKFKNTQGLRGHKTFVHGQFGAEMQQSFVAPPTQQRLELLEEQVDGLAFWLEEVHALALSWAVNKSKIEDTLAGKPFTGFSGINQEYVPSRRVHFLEELDSEE
jgi:hypothetical protein